MGNSKGKQKVNGHFWCNVYLADGLPKLCKADIIDKENNIFRVMCCSSRIVEHNEAIKNKILKESSIKTKLELGRFIWSKVPKRDSWWFVDLYEEEVNEFF